VWRKRTLPARAGTALSCAMLCLVAPIAYAQSPAASMFSNGSTPKLVVLTLATVPLVNTQGAEIYYVDGLARLENLMSDALPSAEAEAKALLEQRIANMGKQALQQQARNASIGLALALNHRITRVPAAIFDNRAIVYGVTDLNAARQLYSAWQQRQPRSATVTK
jgi:integrating conjugative element protein (TIGR03757 family)